MKARIHSLGITGVVTFVMASLVTVAHAESWELRTADMEVKGTRDIEAGRVDKGIRVTETHFASAPYEEKGAMLTNLCLAYILKQDFDAASSYCDRAVAHPRGRSSREAYNNRGVLNAMLGNYAAALSDFEQAGCLRDCASAGGKRNANARMAVARRNLNRAQVQLARQQQDENFRASSSRSSN